MNEDQIFAEAFNDGTMTDAPASEVTQEIEQQPQPVEQVEVTAPVEVDAQTQEVGESQQPRNWMDLVPPEARKELDPILQDWRSNHGRVSALTKKTLEQEAMIAELQAKLSQPAQPSTEQPAEEQAQVDPLEELKREFPTLGESLDKALAYERERIQSQFEQKLSPFEQMRAEQQQREQALQRQTALQQVGQAHPDWQQIVNAPVFQQWIGQQPTAVQNILTDSENPSENIWLLSQFKRDMALANQQRQAQTQVKQQRLAQSAGVKPSGKPQVNDDLDAMFAYAFQNA